MTEELKPVPVPQEQFIAGEVHVVSDPKDGSLRVNAPSNLLVALGLLECAKMVLIQRQQDMQKQMEKQKPVLQAGLDAMRKMGKQFLGR